MKTSSTTPLSKVYEGFETPQLLDLLGDFERGRERPEADEDFYVPRIDTIRAILRARGVNVDATAPLFDEARP
jgi:hypothetical protein